MKRRRFITLLASAPVAWRRLVNAQEQEGMRHVGVLMGVKQADPDAQPRIKAFQQALQELGWFEGRNVRVDYGWPTGDTEQLRAFARSLVDEHPQVIVGTGTAWVAAVMRETRTIPVIFLLVSDPVSSGFVKSLSRPGGNVTGFSNLEASMAGKWLGTLKEIAPHLTRAAMLFNPSTTAGGGSNFVHEFEAAARSLGVTPIAGPVHAVADLETRISELGHEPNSGVVLMSDTFITVHRERIVALAARHRVPAIYPFRYFATSGGLMSYGVSAVDVYRRSASYVDRILRGENPGELPVQGPTTFELVINLKTAKALGLTVPPTLLARADEVIE
jgi:ABC-type uncharacterized transport system substrate-binding protein